MSDIRQVNNLNQLKTMYLLVRVEDGGFYFIFSFLFYILILDLGLA